MSSSSEEVIDRIFSRMHATYGRDFVSQYEGLDMDAVRAVWARELAGFMPNEKRPKGLLKSIAWALDNLPEKVMNAIQFRALARRSPTDDVPRIGGPAPDPERVRSEIAKIKGAFDILARDDGKNWARRILEQEKAGVVHRIYTLKSAQMALGMRSNMQ